MKTVDTRGCACPVPVLMTQKALSEDSSIEVLVDNNTAKNNIERFAKSQGARVSIRESDADDEYVITIEK